jgi:hypothetical protein
MSLCLIVRPEAEADITRPHYMKKKGRRAA